MVTWCRCLWHMTGSDNFPLFSLVFMGNEIIYIYCQTWRETWKFVPSRKFMSPEGDMNLLEGTYLHVSRLTGQLFIIPEDEARRSLAQSVVLWNMTGRHDARRETWSFVVTYLDQSFFFICYSNHMRYNYSNKHHRKLNGRLQMVRSFDSNSSSSWTMKLPTKIASFEL